MVDDGKSIPHDYYSAPAHSLVRGNPCKPAALPAKVSHDIFIRSQVDKHSSHMSSSCSEISSVLPVRASGARTAHPALACVQGA